MNAALLIIAGSETTATALSGATYLLGTNPDVLAKLTAEVRSSFSSEGDITLLSVQNLKYMLAVLDESIRLFPPVPSSLPRVAHQGGDVFCDTYLPANVSPDNKKTMITRQRNVLETTRWLTVCPWQTVIDIWQYPMYRSPKNFHLPDSFIPERWLGDARFANDKKEAFQPFSHGPRNCIGKK